MKKSTTKPGKSPAKHAGLMTVGEAEATEEVQKTLDELVLAVARKMLQTVLETEV